MSLFHSRFEAGRNIRQTAGVAFFAVALVASAQAQYPNKPIRAIVPSGVGGFGNILGRAVTESISPALKQPIVVENRVGADGIIGMEACARAAPDGYTLCLSHPAPVTISLFTRLKLPYDPVKDFIPVVQIAVNNTVMVVNSSLPVNSLAELIALAKSRPKTINWGSWGDASLSRMYLAWVENKTGTSFVHIPYKSPEQAQMAVIAGEVDVSFTNTRMTLEQMKAGRIKPVALIGRKGMAVLPKVPTFIDAGMELRFQPWVGVLVQAGTPRDIVMRLNKEVNTLLSDPTFVERHLTSVSAEPVGGTPEEFATYLDTERKTLAVLMKLANVKPE
jgi:tripartite-type tricarboxylate transporter receptor subunit TctC